MSIYDRSDSTQKLTADDCESFIKMMGFKKPGPSTQTSAVIEIDESVPVDVPVQATSRVKSTRSNTSPPINEESNGILVGSAESVILGHTMKTKLRVSFRMRLLLTAGGLMTIASFVGSTVVNGERPFVSSSFFCIFEEFLKRR